MVSYTLHEPGDPPLVFERGDILLEHGVHLAPRLIEFGQRLRFRGERRPYAWWSHAALSIGCGWLIEAKGQHPVRVVPLTYYDDKAYAAIHVGGTNEMRANAVAFAIAQLGVGYSYLSIFFLVVWSLTGGARFAVGTKQFFCSDLVAEATERLGVIYEGNALTIMPADLAEKFDVVV